MCQKDHTKEKLSIYGVSIKSLAEFINSEKDIIRIRTMLQKMNEICKESGSKFILLIKRETDNSTTKKLEEHLFNPLKKSTIDHYYTDEIIPYLDTNKNDYQIIGDGHPNEKHNIDLAAFLHHKINSLER